MVLAIQASLSSWEFKISAPGRRRLTSAVSTIPTHYQSKILVNVHSPGFFHRTEVNETRRKENRPGGSCEAWVVTDTAIGSVFPIVEKVKIRLVSAHAHVKLKRSLNSWDYFCLIYHLAITHIHAYTHSQSLLLGDSWLCIYRFAYLLKFIL